MLSGLMNSLLWFMGMILLINCMEAVTAASGFTNETDRHALLSIKDLISDDLSSSLSSWNSSLQFCSWQGVTCGRRHRRVTSLNLSSLELAGPLSPHVGNLTFLRVIDLSRNRFHHILPPEIGHLFRLRYLDLANNSFQGELPSNLSHFSNLIFLNLYGNNFRGKIPSELGSLSKLLRMSLASNHFTGSIPPSFGNLSSMQRASLALNNLDGIIPAELGRLSALDFLNLYSNNLSGMVPEQLYNISSLNLLSLAENHLTGSLPRYIGSTLPNLQNLYLGTNQFFGHIPESFVNSSGLVDLDLAFNALTGPVPNNLGNLQNLETINFGRNPLGNENGSDLTFLTSLTNCTNLREVWFFENRLRGVLPISIANLSTNLYWLALSTNYLTGDVPVEIANLKNLEYLAFSENMLTGRLPDSIGRLSKLQELHRKFRHGEMVQEGEGASALKSKVAALLYDLLKKNWKWNWTERGQWAFEKLKRVVMSASVLKLPDFERPFEVCLLGSKFIVKTNNVANTFFTTQKKLSQRQARLQEFLVEYDFKWEHKLRFASAIVVSKQTMSFGFNGFHCEIPGSGWHEYGAGGYG
ncbi:hypothetical protein SADUNF_Sadunf15G0031800 [Salix dunnii]|uniref:Leucine-rich repeat-containing N-terminal plant-type domain-containing protein n=1 Tax=Salix dunnii TaxID=1413687 RepID=A0A835MNI4_9ROSI|nr:hypothetical protein SADUNF_Sadunf15G0031800 [Salix dunnii]